MLDVDVNAILHGSDAGCGNRVAKNGRQETSPFDIFHILEAKSTFASRSTESYRG